MTNRQGQARHPRIAIKPDRSFTYGELENAIGVLHYASIEGMKTFKSRLKHLQRIGVGQGSPGKGQKIRYTIETAIVWAICLEFIEIGLPPEQIKKTVEEHKSLLLNEFVGPIRNSEDQYFIIQPSMFSSRFVGEALVAAPKVEVMGASAIGDALAFHNPEMAAHGQSGSRPTIARAILINLTHLKRALGSVLEIEWL